MFLYIISIDTTLRYQNLVNWKHASIFPYFSVLSILFPSWYLKVWGNNLRMPNPRAPAASPHLDELMRCHVLRSTNSTCSGVEHIISRAAIKHEPTTWQRGKCHTVCVGTSSHLHSAYMGVSKNDGTQQPWIFLLKTIILGCFGGYHHLRKPPYSLSSKKRQLPPPFLV